MTLLEILDPNLIVFDLEADSKEDVIDTASNLLWDAKKIYNKQDFKKAVFEREAQMSTGMGMGIAIPHCHSDSVKDTCFVLLKLKKGIAWESLDDEPVKFVILLAVPVNASNAFLEILSAFSYNLMDDAFREGLVNAESVKDIKNILKRVG